MNSNSVYLCAASSCIIVVATVTLDGVQMQCFCMRYGEQKDDDGACITVEKKQEEQVEKVWKGQWTRFNYEMGYGGLTSLRWNSNWIFRRFYHFYFLVIIYCIEILHGSLHCATSKGCHVGMDVRESNHLQHISYEDLWWCDEFSIWIWREHSKHQILLQIMLLLFVKNHTQYDQGK